MDIKTAGEIFDKYAREYQDKFMDFDLYNDTFDLFCNHIVKENASILELACGPGNICRYLLKKRPHFKIFGIDISQNMVDLARMNNPTSEFQVMDCRDIGGLDRKFDGIMCGFCLPYLLKEEALHLIYNSSKLLSPEGVLYISTMEDSNSKSGYKTSSAGTEQTYMNYHEADYLIKALEANDVRIIDLQRKDFPEADGTQTKDLVILAQK